MPTIASVELRGNGVAEVLLEDHDEPVLIAIDTMVLHRLAEGLTFTDDEWQPIREEGRNLLAVRRALALASRRRRTERELRSALRRDFAPCEIDAAVERLRALEYLDDATAAREHVERRRSAARGSGLLRRELQARGVDSSTVATALEGRDEAPAAEALAIKRARALTALDEPTRRRRLYDLLRRRGFADDTARRAADHALAG
jgi:regulatory protein